MVKWVVSPGVEGATVTPGMGVAVVPFNSARVSELASTPAAVSLKMTWKHEDEAGHNLLGSLVAVCSFRSFGFTSVRRSRFTATRVTPGKMNPLFPMFVLDVLVSSFGSSRFAMRKVAVVNCALPSGNGAFANAFGVAAPRTPVHEMVYVVPGRS